jgi:hypothetical protein
MISDRLDFHQDGAEHIAGALSDTELDSVLAALADQPSDHAGVRLFGVAALRPVLAADGPLGRIAAKRMTGAPRPVRAILFDKTETTNWSLGWHQDRVIAVKQRIEVEGFGPWTRKHGALHVAPPAVVLSKMTTLRLHLDPTPADNAPLLIAPGSHRLGRIAEADVPSVVAACGVFTCLAERGDVWLYSTPILHASEAAKAALRRRVLQLDYAVEDLPGGLEWAGV